MNIQFSAQSITEKDEGLRLSIISLDKSNNFSLPVKCQKMLNDICSSHLLRVPAEVLSHTPVQKTEIFGLL